MEETTDTTTASKSKLNEPLGARVDTTMTMEALLGWRYRVFLLPFEESRKFKAPTPAQYLQHMDWLLHHLRKLSATVLADHRCSLPGWEKERCLKDEGETCGTYLGRDATKCEHYNKCQCDACKIARSVLNP